MNGLRIVILSDCWLREPPLIITLLSDHQYMREVREHLAQLRPDVLKQAA
jgi:hypothetical protein